jgi:hypothetical protein
MVYCYRLQTMLMEAIIPTTGMWHHASLLLIIVIQLRGATTWPSFITDTNPGEGGSQQNDAVLRVPTQHPYLLVPIREATTRHLFFTDTNQNRGSLKTTP